MRATFSEFSYGFAFTYGLVKVLPQLKIAPLIPSLGDEGKIGYDVELNLGFPIFFQYKLSDLLVRSSAKYWRYYYTSYFRFSIYSRKRSKQHDLLQALADSGREAVYYAAPLFNSAEEFNEAYSKNTVTERSIWIPVQELPRLKDDSEHHVTFTEAQDPRWHSEEPILIEGDFSAQRACTTLQTRFEVRDFLQIGDYLPTLQRRLLGILRENDVVVEDTGDVTIARLLATYFGLQMVILHNEGTTA